jgi:glycosyltransferase involved in cell wall biosynthesis
MPTAVPDVLHLTPFPAAGAARPPAGVPAFVSRLVPAYSRAGAARQLVLADRTGPGPDVIELPHPGVEVSRAYSPGVRFGRVRGRFARRRPGVVHAQHEVFLYGGPAAAVQFPGVMRAARRAGHARVVTVHGVVDLTTVDRGFVDSNGSRMPPRAVRLLLRRLIRGAALGGDAVIVHDEGLAARLVEQYGVPAERVAVIPLPAPEAAPVPRDEARAALGLDRPSVLFFGFVTGYKGLPLLLDGWERYRAAGGAAELVVAGGRHPRLAGDPTYERGYAASMERAAAIGGVRWDGYVSDAQVPAYLSAADALVLPYRDGLSASGPMSFAFAYGLPVLASDVLRDSAPHPGGVFPRDPEALAVVLHETLETPLGAELALASRRAGEQRSLGAVADETLALYRRVSS